MKPKDPKTDAGFRQHILEQRFKIVGQPVVDIATGKALHDEWLVRFDSDEGLEGLLRPAEISGAIATLDISMLEHAIKTLNADKRRRPIAVNLSGASMDTPNFQNLLFSTLETLHAAPSRLIFELTETWDLRDLTIATQVLGRLRKRGHPLCLDDVGAGAASIRYLRAFETDWLKIDGEFVKAAMTNSRDKTILDAILGLKSALNVKFIAEGVEDPSVIDFVKASGFDAGQGYAFGTPVKVPLRSFGEN